MGTFTGFIELIYNAMKNLRKTMFAASGALLCINMSVYSSPITLDIGNSVVKEAIENPAPSVVRESFMQAGKMIKVTGKVVDKNGEPVIGASIKEEGTTNGTITDLDGNFSLNVTEGAMLEISFIGFKPERLQAHGNKAITVTMREDTELLDEVVVIGYGTQRKGDVTSAVASVKADDSSFASSTCRF